MRQKEQIKGCSLLNKTGSTHLWWQLKILSIRENWGKYTAVQLNCFWNRNADYYKNSWKGTKDLDGGTLYTQFSHFIDLLYWFLGDVKSLNAFTGNFDHQGLIEFEDTGVATLEIPEWCHRYCQLHSKCLQEKYGGLAHAVCREGNSQDWWSIFK